MEQTFKYAQQQHGSQCYLSAVPEKPTKTIRRPVSRSLTEKSLFSRFRTTIGTSKYMAILLLLEKTGLHFTGISLVETNRHLHKTSGYD